MIRGLGGFVCSECVVSIVVMHRNSSVFAICTKHITSHGDVMPIEDVNGSRFRSLRHGRELDIF